MPCYLLPKGGSATYGMNGGWSKNKSRDNDWDGHFSDPFNQKPNRTRDLSTVADEFPTKSPSKQPTSLSSKQSETNPDLSELMKKFANATSISSDAFFYRNDVSLNGLICLSLVFNFTSYFCHNLYLTILEGSLHAYVSHRNW